MNIVFVCAEYSSSNQPMGGFGSYVKNIVPALIKQGHKVQIICQENTFNLSSVSSFSPLGRIIKFLNYPFLFSLAAAIKLHSIHKQSPIDIVEGGDFAGELFWYVLFKNDRYPKVIIKLHTPSFIIRKYNSEKMNTFFTVMERLEIFCLKYADQIYSPTKNLASLIEKRIKRQISTIIPYPVPMTSKVKKIKRKKNLILYAGKIQTKKGVFILLKAIPNILKRNPQIKFLFMGPDTRENNISVKDQMKKIINDQSLGHSVEIKNPLPRNKLITVFQQATITVIPSLWENFPNILLEAATSKSPIIATNIGGISEMIVHKRNGLLIKPNDSKSLSQTINFLLSQPKLQRNLSQNLYKAINEGYNSEHIAKITIKFYEKTLKERRAGSKAL